MYEWSAGKPPAEQLQLVSILPQTPEQRAKGEEVAANEGLLGVDSEMVRHAVSADGSRVFFSAETEPGSKMVDLYMRDLSKGKTGETLIVGGPRSLFQDASANGSRAFYTEHINGVVHLFVCEVTENGEGRLACHTSDIAGGVQGMIVGVSEDGSYAYYVAGDVLYEAHDESGAWHTTRVAQLSSEDEPDWANNGTTSRS